MTHSGDPESSSTGPSDDDFQNWTEQAGEPAEHPPVASDPRQHYAAFYVEFLLESDNSVRGTRVHHHETDAREAWAEWDVPGSAPAVA